MGHLLAGEDNHVLDSAAQIQAVVGVERVTNSDLAHQALTSLKTSGLLPDGQSARVLRDADLDRAP